MTTKFQEKVYAKLRKVPRGKITTYKTLARSVGTKAYRAVGSVMKKNPYSFLDGGDVPCHRVVKSNGDVGGFASGTRNKIEILKREGLVIENGKIKNFENKLYKFN